MATKRAWHKRWHGNALNGMRGLSLELRGAYTTLTDLMYDRGGPIPLHERRLCGDLDCDLRVLRRVLNELIAAGKIRLWADRNGVVIVNQKVLETLGVGGYLAETCGELPAEVGAKFAIAKPELSPNFHGKHNENNEKSNVKIAKIVSLEEEEEEEERTPLPPKGKTAEKSKPEKPSEALLEASPRRKPSRPIPDGYPDTEAIEKYRTAAQDAGANLDVTAIAQRFRNWALAKDHRYADWSRTWANWMGREIDNAPKRVVALQASDPWQQRCRAFVVNAYWDGNNWGPKPGRSGCEVPMATLVQFGLAPKRTDTADLLLFPADRMAAE